MKSTCFVFLLMAFCSGAIFPQNKIEQFRQFYQNADLACYEQKIQQDLNKFDKWYIDSLPILDTFPFSRKRLFRPGNVNLKKENKVFALAVSLANTENYNFNDDIYNYLIIDSLRTFIIVCIDDKMNVTGFTDTTEPGIFIDVKDNFYYDKKTRNQIRKIIKNIRKEAPEIIMYCNNLSGAFLYLKNDNLYIYSRNTDKSQELNEYIRGYPDIDMLRRSNGIILPFTKSFEGGGGSKPLVYRLTGHTPPDELRICP